MSKTSKVVELSPQEKPRMSTALTPAQNVASQIRVNLFSLRNNVLQIVNDAEKAINFGVVPFDGSLPVTSADLVEALGPVDVQTVRNIIAEFRAFLAG